MSLNVANGTTLLIATFLAVLSYFAKSIVIVLIHVLVALVIVATLHLAAYGLIGDTGISPNLVLVMALILTLLLTGITSYFKTYSRSQFPSLWQEAILLVSSSILVMRWPVSSIGRNMAILKPEDNSRWISFAAELLPFRQGAVHPSAAVGGGAGGGHVFDYFITMIHSLTNLFIEDRSSNLSTAYVSILNTYRLTIVLLLFFSSLIVFQILRKLTHPTLAIVSAILVPIFMYPALYDVVLRTGHLSLMVAMLFLLTTIVYCLSIDANSSSSNSELLLIAIISFGIGGIWWPALPISLVMAVICGLIILRNLGRNRKPILLISLVAVVVLAWRFMSIYFIQYFQVISVRSFFTAMGGVQEVSNLILGLSLISIFYINSRTLESKNRKTRFSIWILPVVALSVYAISLLIASYFTGPYFSPNYSVKKVMFLLYLVGIPFLFAGLIIVVSQHVNKKSALFAPLLAVGLAINSFGLDINMPRQMPDLAWGKGLQSIIEKDPKAVILCSTNTSNSYEAYVCTRQARNLLATGNWLTKAWQDYILTPQIGSIEKTMEDIYYEFRLESPSSRIYLLSLEPQFTFAEQNKWWMEPLPWAEINVVDGQTGNVIPNSSVNN
jgi:hypothetical protein